MEFGPEKVIGFASTLVPLVKKGTKTLTYRMGDKWDFLNTDDIINVCDSSTGEVFGKSRIISKEKTLFKDLPIDRGGARDLCV